MAPTSTQTQLGSMASAGPHGEVRCPRCGGSVTYDRGTVLSEPVWVTAYEERDAVERRKPLLAGFYGCNACDFCATVADVQNGRAA